MEAAWSSEMLTSNYHTTQYYNPENHNFSQTQLQHLFQMEMQRCEKMSTIVTLSGRPTAYFHNLLHYPIKDSETVYD